MMSGKCFRQRMHQLVRILERNRADRLSRTANKNQFKENNNKQTTRVRRKQR
jgi:hypothetical protein